MKGRHLLSGSLLCCLSCVSAAAIAAGPPTEDAKLRQLDVSAGRWVYHGHFLAEKGGHPSAWTWHEDCGWSDNRAFMLCSFSNSWAGRHVDSVVVDTYNRGDDTFWHYEIFDAGGPGAKPFAARMRIDGNTRVEAWTRSRGGKPVRERIVYRFVSGDKVTVLFQQSTDGSHWRTTAAGAGEKTGA